MLAKTETSQTLTEQEQIIVAESESAEIVEPEINNTTELQTIQVESVPETTPEKVHKHPIIKVSEEQPELIVLEEADTEVITELPQILETEEPEVAEIFEATSFEHAEVHDGVEADKEVLFINLQNEEPELEIYAIEPVEPKILIEILPIKPEELVEKLESLPDARLEEAVAIMELVIQTVKRVEQSEEVGETDLELVTAGLEQLVERFLTCLEIEHDETHVIALVQAILDGSNELSFDNFMALQEEGTHERKYISSWIMAILNQPIVTKKTDHSFIGKYVLSLVSINKFQLSYS